MGNDFYTASGLLNVFSLNSVLNVTGAFNKEKALVGALSMIMKLSRTSVRSSIIKTAVWDFV